jgi:septum formation protein
MLYPSFEKLLGKRVVLASTSPRRREMFDRMRMPYEIVGSGFAEDLDKSQYATAEAYSAATCREKAAAVLRQCLSDGRGAPSVVVSADTIVVCDGKIYEKPEDRADARRMISEIAGRSIDVVTAVSVAYRVSPAAEEASYEWLNFAEHTAMDMIEMDDATIDAYIARGEASDYSCALAYQGGAFILVSAVRGCYYNLVGFPAARFYRELTNVIDRVC